MNETDAAIFPFSCPVAPAKGTDLHRFLVKNPASTFFMRAGGSAMMGSGILDGDILIVDRSVPPGAGPVIACIGGELVLADMKAGTDGGILIPSADGEPPLRALGRDAVSIWGTVTARIHRVR